MVHCPNCNTKCVEDANYCHNCGIYLIEDTDDHKNHNPAQTSSQEEVNLALRRLMPTHYINKLLSTKGHVEGERRVVTILFSDVKGSTSLAEKLDPEEVLEIMNGAFEVLIKPITHYEGTIARLMGDAILAFFGAPIAHEDDPDRACRAALEIIKGAKIYGKKLKKEKDIDGFNVRVGINTGLVVVAEVGTDLRVEYTAMGDAVNIAARMESAAESGTILITEDTKKLIENNFVTAPLGPINVKGKEKPLNVFQLKSMKKIISKNKNNNGFYSTIVGREAELSLMQNLVASLHRGKGVIISIVGEHGIGKSRLAYECRVQTQNNLRWIEGRALTYNTNDGYWLIREVLKKIIIDDKDFSGEKLRAKVGDHINALPGIKFDDVYPYIGYLLNINLEKKFKKKIQLSDAETLKGQIQYACREFIRLESLKDPLAIYLEDLHWSDIPSRELLKNLFNLVESLPVLFILDFRMNENEMWKFHEHNLKTIRKNYQVFQLHELDTENSRQLINNLAGNYSVSNEFCETVLQKTGGNPFFIEEVLRSFVDKGILGKEGKGISIKESKLMNVPNLLQNVIMSRLDCLTAYQKLLLQSASVIGRTFNDEILDIIMPKHPSLGRIEDELLELVKRGFILERKKNDYPSSSAKFEREYFFKHSILQDVISDSLLQSQKRKLHISIGEAIERSYSENNEDFANSLALHFDEGNHSRKAVFYYQIAANNSKKIFANDEAIFFYSKILSLVDNNGSVKFDYAPIYESLGDLYFQIAKYSKAIEYYSKIFNCTIEKDKKRIIYYKCGKVYERWGKYSDAIKAYNNGLKNINNLAEGIIDGRIQNGMGMVAFRKGDLETAETHNMIALKIFETMKSEIDLADVYNNLGIIYCKLEKLDVAMNYHKRCLIIREKLCHTSGLAASYNNLGYLYQLMGELDKAINYYEKSVDFCEKTGNQHGLAKTYDNLSHAYLTLQREEIAMAYNLKAITILGKIALDNSVVQHDVWLQSGVW